MCGSWPALTGVLVEIIRLVSLKVLLPIRRERRDHGLYSDPEVLSVHVWVHPEVECCGQKCRLFEKYQEEGIGRKVLGETVIKRQSWRERERDREREIERERRKAWEGE